MGKINPMLLLPLIALFFFVYDCFFSFLPVTTNVILSVIGLACFPFVFLRKDFANTSKDLLVFFFILFVYALFATTVNQTSDYSFISKELIRAIVIPFFAAYLIASILVKFTHSVDMVLKMLVAISLIQCVIIISCFFSNSIKEMFIAIQNISGRETIFLTYGFRSLGLGIRFDSGSIYMSIALLVSTYLYLLSQCKKHVYVLFWIVQMIAGLMLARSIILGIFFSLLMFFLYEKDFVKKSKFLAILLGGGICFLFVLLYFVPDFFSRYSEYLNWIFQYVANTEHGSDTISTLTTKMYFLPENGFTFLFGDGLFQTEKGYSYMDVDPLIMRHILYWGVLGLVLYLSFLVTIVYKLGKNASFFLENNNKQIFKVLLTCLLCMLVCFYCKLDYHFLKIFFLFYWFFCLMRKT